MQRIVISLLFLFLLSSSFASQASPSRVASLQHAITNIGPEMSVYRGPDQATNAPPPAQSPDWKPLDREVFTTTPSRPVFWVSGKVRVARADVTDWLVLEPMAQTTQVFVDGRKVLPGPINQWTPMDRRAIPHHSLIFPLPFKTAGVHRITVRMEPKFSIRTPFVVVDKTGLVEVTDWQDLFLGGFVAAALALLIYNLLIYFSVRDPLYLIYCAGVLFTSTYALAILGALAYWLPDWMMNDKTGLTAVYAMVITHGFFVMYLLRTWEVTPRLHRWLKFALAVQGLLFLGLPWLSENIIVHSVMPSTIIIYIVALYAGIKRARQGEVPAFIFLLGWTPLILLTTYTGLEYAGVLPPSYWTLYFVPSGQIWEMLCFSLALASRIKHLRDHRDLLQRQHIAATEAARDALQKSNQIKDHFLSAVSHELRTPLHTISGHLDLLREAPLRDDQREALGAIERANQRMTRQVGGILDFADAQADQMLSSPQRVRLDGLLALLQTEFSQEARFKSVGLSTHRDAQVPEVVYLDGLLLEKALYQLIDNAVKFTPAGGQVLVECQAQTDHEPPQLIWTVTDSGEGIPSGRRAQVFKAFEQGEGGLTRRFSGVGLGLPLAQTILRALNGKLELLRSDENGTCVRCTVPYVPIYQVGEAQSDDSPVWPVTEGGNHPRKVLVVEDDTGNRMVLRKQLDRLGLDTEGACDGREAVASAQRERWDLILMDCQMPLMDGMEATRLIRAHAGLNQTTPIVAVTANATQGYRQQCLDAGMTDFLVKPLRMNTLTSLLQQFSLIDVDAPMATASGRDEGLA